MARLFVAIILPTDVEEHLSGQLDGLRTARPELRWVPPVRWHLTLEFLGECGRHEADRQLGRWERRARRSRAMSLRLESGGAFPRVSSARVLWAGLGGELTTWRALAGYGQAPHVTLARTRTPLDLTGPVDELASYHGPTWTVTEIAMVESHLRHPGERGPRYEPLEFFALG